MLIIRTDRELEMQRVDAALRAEGHTLVVLPDGTPEAELAKVATEADIILMCYTPITYAMDNDWTRS
jgi:D-3-phosphoglycerate dehydrogenase